MSNDLHISHLSAGYGHRTIISDASLTAFGGQLTAIIGRNGSGKSTLLRTLAGDIRATAGSAVANDCDILTLPPRERSKLIGIVDQQTEALPIRVIDYIMLGRTPHRSLLSLNDSQKDTEICNRIIKQLNISHLSASRMDQISGGERQMASIAKALAQEPRILLLDEPTSNLDLKNQKDILDAISETTHTEQLITIMVMHDVNLALTYADSICIMTDGRITQHANTDGAVTQEMLEKTYNTSVKIITDSENGRKAVVVEKDFKK
ncbi:MAG: ABC transporter ATP-binding protein [Bacteroidales bacterium]|nr:ABC transporter ATP-binding protein [Bacteroidales bacterium]